jgi:hypothetical protein
MGILQKEFDRVVKHELSEAFFLRAFIRRALERRNIGLTDDQIATVAAAIRNAPEGTLEFAVPPSSDSSDERPRLSVAELTAAMPEAEEKVSAGIEKAIADTLDHIPASVLATLYADAPRALHVRRVQQRRFEKGVYKRWKSGLDRLEMLLMIAQEAGQTFLDDVQTMRCHNTVSDAPDESLLDALIRLHVRACRIASEIICLLKGGFADGANARWRSLHECAVTAMFLAQHGDRTAERYLRHVAVEQFRASQQYQQHCTALGLPPLTNVELNDLAGRYETAIAEFGADFKNEYGWAAESIGIRSPRFADIESHLDMGRWRPYYKMACHSVHAGAQGLYFCLSIIDGHEPSLLAGASNAGLCDPGHSAAISLMMVSAATLTAKSNLDGLVSVKVMQLLCDDVGDALLDAHQQLEKDLSLGDSSGTSSDG